MLAMHWGGSTTPATITMVPEGIEGLSRARNQGHRCLPTKAGRSGQWRDLAPSRGDLSMGQLVWGCRRRRVARDQFLGEVWVKQRG
jgi:hypothetical protein